jgi:hypothetical protein
MSTVLLKVPATDFASQMAIMREWLNDHGYEPLRFAYDGPSDDVFVIRLDFSRSEDAEAFAQRFSGPAIRNGGEEADPEIVHHPTRANA